MKPAMMSKTGEGEFLGNEMDFFSKQFSSSVRLERGRIVNVDYNGQNRKYKYSCHVKTQAGRDLQRVQMATPYYNTTNGSGHFVLPEINAHVLVGYIEGDHPVILGFIGATDDDGGYGNNRTQVSPGSHIIETSGGAGILVENSGIIEERASPLCRRRYIQNNEIIFDQCVNYFMDAGGGVIKWELKPESDKSTNALANFVLRGYQNNDWASSLFGEIRIGDSHRFLLAAGGPGDGEEEIRAQIEFDDEDNITVEGASASDEGPISTEWLADGTFIITGRNGSSIVIDPQGLITITGQAGAKIEMDTEGNVNIEGTNINISAPSLNIDGVLSCKTLNVDGIITARNGLANFWDPEK